MINNLHIFTSSLYEMNSVIIELDSTALCFDLGVTHKELDTLKNEIVKMNKNTIYHLVTHCDFDHVIGCKLIPNQINVGFNYIGNENLLQAKKSEWFKYHQDMPDLIGEPFDLDFGVKTKGDAKIIIDGTEIEIIKTSGHTLDGLSYYIKSINVLIIGDLLASCDIPIIEDSVDNYIKSLKKIKDVYERSYPIIVPGHGNIIDNKDQFIKIYSRDMKYLKEVLLKEKSDVEIWLDDEGLLSEENIYYHKNNNKQ